MRLPAGQSWDLTKSLRRSAQAEWARFIARATPSLNREVAIKVCPESLANDPDRMARFEREAQMLAVAEPPEHRARFTECRARVKPCHGTRRR